MGRGALRGGRATRLTLAAVCALTVVPQLALGTARASAARRDGTRGKIAGFGVSPPLVPGEVQALDFARLRATGGNVVTIDAFWDVDSPQSGVVHPGARTISDADLIAEITQAKQHGLSVYIVPKWWCATCTPSWRGAYHPRDVDLFFASYTAMVDHYADIARLTGLDTFFVGSEMATLQGYTTHWRTLIADVRSRFSGRLIYDANWGHLDAVHFWDAVDIISVSAYFPLSAARSPRLAEVLRAWHGSTVPYPGYRRHDWFAELRSLARRTHRPILFGEAGYLSAEYAGWRPYQAQAQGATDGRLQADLYQALLQTFEREPWWLGVIWWDWETVHADRGYSPRDKPAELLLKRWYVDAARPRKPDQSLTTGHS